MGVLQKEVHTPLALGECHQTNIKDFTTSCLYPIIEETQAADLIIEENETNITDAILRCLFPIVEETQNKRIGVIKNVLFAVAEEIQDSNNNKAVKWDFWKKQIKMKREEKRTFINDAK